MPHAVGDALLAKAEAINPATRREGSIKPFLDLVHSWSTSAADPRQEPQPDFNLNLRLKHEDFVSLGFPQTSCSNVAPPPPRPYLTILLTAFFHDRGRV